MTPISSQEFPSTQKHYASISGDVDLLTDNGNNGPAVCVQVFGAGTIILTGRDDVDSTIVLTAPANIFGQYTGIKSATTATQILVLWA